MNDTRHRYGWMLRIIIVDEHKDKY
jgi:hypothetical protein